MNQNVNHWRDSQPPMSSGVITVTAIMMALKPISMPDTKCVSQSHGLPDAPILNISVSAPMPMGATK